MKAKPMNSTLPASLPPLNSDATLSLRVSIREAQDLAGLLCSDDFRSAENEALATRLQRAAESADTDELTEGIYFARKALNLSCACCGEELANAEPSRERQYCPRSCGTEELV